VTERRRCACLGVIEAEDEPKAIAKAVQEHQRKVEHSVYVDRMLASFGNFPVPSLKKVAG
jgi:hypothetical protein